MPKKHQTSKSVRADVGDAEADGEEARAAGGGDGVEAAAGAEPGGLLQAVSSADFDALAVDLRKKQEQLAAVEKAVCRADFDALAVDLRHKQEQLAAVEKDLLERMAAVESEVAVLDGSSGEALVDVERRLALRVENVERGHAVLFDRFEAETTGCIASPSPEDSLGPQMQRLQREVEMCRERLEQTANSQKMLQQNCEEHAGRIARLAAPTFRDPDKISYPQNLLAAELLLKELLAGQSDVRDKHSLMQTAVQNLHQRVHLAESSVQDFDSMLKNSHSKQSAKDLAQAVAVEQKLRAMLRDEHVHQNTNLQKVAKVFKDELHEQAAEAQRGSEGLRQALDEQGAELRSKLASQGAELVPLIAAARVGGWRLCARAPF